MRRGRLEVKWTHAELETVRAIYGAYGPKGTWSALQGMGSQCSLHSVRNVASEMGVKCEYRRKPRVDDEAYCRRPYRALTGGTIRSIRLWHAEGRTALYLARQLHRPLWFVKAVIAGEPWQERWEREKERAA